ncbi:SRPBCC domain-containing protein [Alicyclobacillus sp.]|uniref:SRPBCC family protein n=1 Tax=Alicyclobacillus sp. TaxID=61169 RepID=UPI0025C15139|nr:SRPBCC domain-containing protein [Alicyclobacillus sp.]MCL6515313.1 SRPBCC domain-containing protein [Alicyclobacillus sp.]
MIQSPAHTLPDIRHSVHLHAPIDQVWHAVATAEGLAGWWMPNTLVPEAGRDFVLHAGPWGDSECRVLEVRPPHHLSFRWDTDWRLTFELQPTAEGETELTLIHGGWDAAKSTRFGQPHTAVRKVMDGGWDKLIHDKLPAYVQQRTGE